ncbi:MAG TPA: alpha/beta hydrolase [Candidatus Nanopelagicales bacterium]
MTTPASADRRYRIPTVVGALAVRVIGDGPPAVLWHSLFVDSRSWQRMVPELATRRRLVLVEGPGHGASGDPGRPYTNEECTEAAVAVLDDLDLREPVDWVGNAWGGHLGTILAATHPERCRSLVALGTPVAGLTTAERARTHLLLGLHRLIGARGPVVQGATNVLLSGHTRSHDPEAVALVGECLRRAEPHMLRNAVASVSLHRTDQTPYLRRIEQPTMLVTGAEHHGYLPEQARAAAGLLRRGRVEVVPDAAYLIPLEAPAQAAALVLDFWAALERDAGATPPD